MSNEVATSTEQALAAQRESMAERLQGLGGGGSVNIVRTSNKNFVFPDEELVPKELEVVVLDWALQNSYFAQAYVPGQKQRPDCIAVGQSAATITPSQNSPDIQNDGQPCATCWANQFGSGTGNAKACKNQIRIAFILPDEGPEGDIYIVNVSPMGIKGFKEYIAKISARNYALTQLVTRLGFDMKQAYDKLTFAASPRSKEIKDDVPGYVARTQEATDILLREPSFNTDNDE